MKKSAKDLKMTILGLTLAILTSVGVVAHADGAPSLQVKKSIVPTHVFAPTGFDSNDEVEFVIQGYYPSTCYHNSGVTVKTDQVKKVITVASTADVSITGICADMLVFYQRTVEVGVLNTGDYKIEFENEKGGVQAAGSIKVVTATGPNIDEFLYAPVQAASVRNDKTAGTVLTLSGQYTNSCAEYQETKIIQNVPDVIEILPIMRLANKGDCKQEHRSFHVDIPVQSNAKGETLIHIRALNGQAVNVVHYFE